MRLDIFVTAVLGLALGIAPCLAQGGRWQLQQQQRQAAQQHRLKLHQQSTSSTNSRSQRRGNINSSNNRATNDPTSTASIGFFKPIELSGSAAIENGTSVIWNEADWLQPSGAASRANDWELFTINVKGHKIDWPGTQSWVTKCGYLRWDTELNKIQYDAEVDGCQEAWTFRARNTNDKTHIQIGRARVTVAVNHCVYASCEHAGCPDCKCTSTKSGTCACGGGEQGFTSGYDWKQDKNYCAYVPLLAAGSSSTTSPGLYEARLGESKVWVPFRFDSKWGSKCLPGRAAAALEVTDVHCSRLTTQLDQRKATTVSAAPSREQAGAVDALCSEFDGMYKVVVEVPPQVGQYQCYMTLNDGIEDRALAELRVKG